MAQTVGALVGIWDRGKNQSPRPGYLIAIPEATFELDRFLVGDELLITAKRVWGDSELASFECDVALLARGSAPFEGPGGNRVAKGQLSVYRRALPGSKQHD
jgi:predicted hotdog family 3-hydroxylacyl-ACP dehydratase